MRKQTKLKKRSCPMCKPHKMKWENRWKAKDRASMKASDKEIKQAA